jgi:hypothetical protein
MKMKPLAILGIALSVSVPVSFVAHPAFAASPDGVAQALVSSTLGNLGLDNLSPELTQVLSKRLAAAIASGVIDPAIAAQVESLLENPDLLSGLDAVFDDHLLQESDSWTQSPLYDDSTQQDNNLFSGDGSVVDPSAPTDGTDNGTDDGSDPSGSTEDDPGSSSDSTDGQDSGSSDQGDSGDNGSDSNSSNGGGYGSGGHGNHGWGGGSGRGEGGRGSYGGNDSGNDYNDDSYDDYGALPGATVTTSRSRDAAL